jgi:hypothetical protein
MSQIVGNQQSAVSNQQSATYHHVFMIIFHPFSTAVVKMIDP